MAIFSRKKSGKDKLKLCGFPGDADTSKSLLTAAEKGMKVEFELVDILGGGPDTSEYRALSPFGKVPCLSAGEFVTSGETSILSYLELRGLTNPLNPRKARLLGEQNYWVQIARENVAPHVETMMQEIVYGPMRDSGYTPDEAAVEKARSALARAFDALNNQLQDKQYVIGDFSFADIHWTAYTHSCLLAGQQELIENRANVKAWYEQIQQRRSQSDKSIVPYDQLPTLEDVRNKRLKSVA